MEQIDLANQYADENANRGVQSVLEALAGQGSAECIECGDDIPQARREAMPNCRRCIHCQEAEDNHRKHRRN